MIGRVPITRGKDPQLPSGLETQTTNRTMSRARKRSACTSVHVNLSLLCEYSASLSRVALRGLLCRNLRRDLEGEHFSWQLQRERAFVPRWLAVWGLGIGLFCKEFYTFMSVFLLFDCEP